MRLRLLSAVGLAAIWLIATAISGPADASGRSRNDPPQTAFHDWTGFYLGVNAGYGWSGESIGLVAGAPSTQSLFLDGPGVHSIAGNAKGVLGGAQVGFNWQSGRIVYGLEMDIDAANISSSEDVPIFVGAGRNFHGDQRLSWLGTLRARLGAAPASGLLVYVTGGVAGGHADANVSMKADIGCAIGACFDGSTTKTMWGWAAGFGLEYALAKNWSIKSEYLHYDVGSLEVVATDPRLPTWDKFYGTVDIRGDLVRLGLNYKFN